MANIQPQSNQVNIKKRPSDGQRCGSFDLLIGSKSNLSACPCPILVTGVACSRHRNPHHQVKEPGSKGLLTRVNQQGLFHGLHLGQSLVKTAGKEHTTETNCKEHMPHMLFAAVLFKAGQHWQLEWRYRKTKDPNPFVRTRAGSSRLFVTCSRGSFCPSTRSNRPLSWTRPRCRKRDPHS